MIGAVLLYLLIPTLIACSGDGNIHLLENEVAEALKACSIHKDDLINNKEGTKTNQRQRRSEEYQAEKYGDISSWIDSNIKQMNQYNHERRNTSDLRDQLHILNSTGYDYGGPGYNGRLDNTVTRSGMDNKYSYVNRTRRSETLLKPDHDQCLSQCVFANLQVVDAKGIPREAEFWNKVQTSVTSQQSRTALRDQIRACFQDLQTEAEDNGCSYSNKLERCLVLRLSDRKMNGTTTQGNT